MNEFLTIEQFPAAMQKVEGIFGVDARLPEQVFKRPYRFYLFCEFSLEWGFLEVLQKMHSPLAAETVLLTVIDPNPIDRFYERSKYIPAFYFNASIDERSLTELCMRRLARVGDWADSIAINALVETYIPASASWAIWAEREPEISVVGLDDPALAIRLIDDNGYWVEAESATDKGGFANAPYRGRGVSKDFRDALIANYGNRADLERKLGRKVTYGWEK